MKKYYLGLLLIWLQFLALAQKEGFASNGNVKIQYRCFGSGKALLIINGGPGMNSDGFTDLAIHLSKKCLAITYDQRGTGQSTIGRPDSLNISMKLMVEDLEVLRKYLKLDSWLILGHSFGGMLASYYTALHPDRVKGLILSSSGGIDLELLSYASKAINSRLSSQDLDSISYWSGRINAGDSSHTAKLKKATFLTGAYVYNRKNIPTIAERLTQSNMQVNSLVWQNLQAMHFDCKKELSNFTKPVLIIQGRQDIIEEKTARKAEGVFKNSELVLLENCVHYGWLDQPDEYYERVTTFIHNN